MPRKTQYNNITTPELIVKINPKNKRLMSDYLTYLKSIQRSEQTVKSYQNDLEIFFCWCIENTDNKFFVDITKRDIIAFQNFLLYNNGNSPARVRRLKSTLSSLSNYIENILDDEPEFKGFRNIIKKVENPINQPVREKTIFQDDDLEKLLSILIEKKQYQKACILALGMFSGRRKSELTRFKVDYFTDDNIIYGSLYKTPEKVKTKGRGKGKYLYVYTLYKDFKPYLDLWIEERQRLGIESEWLFVSKKNNNYEQVTIDTLNSYAQSFSRLIDCDFYWHSLRHYYTTMLARQSIPDNVIQEIVGWESADMVRIYKDISTDEELGKYFDENGIKEVNQGNLSDL